MLPLAVDDAEVAAAIIEPHFAAVRDVFVEHAPEGGEPLRRLLKTRLLVDESIHDSPRHYAATTEDGRLIVVAPQIVDLPFEQMVAILTHEFGHAADFSYPGQWVLVERYEPARYIGDRDDKLGRRVLRLWNERSEHQVEWAADAIARAVTGHEISYCGPCMVQCFSGGQRRPAGLR